MTFDQICRRYFKDETIPHAEKVFSIFEPHTEWIAKGKAGSTKELGLRVCIVESSDGFVLHHRVMENETDDKVAVVITRETRERFPTLKSCSYDKGFHSPQNQQNLRKELDFVVLPKKGRRTPEEQAHEGSEQFGELRRKHSAVESAVNPPRARSTGDPDLRPEAKSGTIKTVCNTGYQTLIRNNYDKERGILVLNKCVGTLRHGSLPGLRT